MPIAGLDVLAGLANAGAQGGIGGAEGLIRGEGLKRQFQSEDMLNQIRALDMLLKTQQASQPAYQFHGDRMFAIPPGGGMPKVTELPPTKGGEARMQGLMEQINLNKQRAELAEQRAQGLQSKDVLGTYMRILNEQGPGAAATYLEEVKKVTQAQSHTTPTDEIKPSIHQWDDDQGQRHESVTTFNTKTGKWDTQVRTIGPGKGKTPERPLSAPPGTTLLDPKTRQPFYTAPERPERALAPRETTTTNFKVTPQQEIKDEKEIVALRSALPKVVNEIAGNPHIHGWNQPGAFVRVDGYAAPVRREDVIAQRFLSQTGVGVRVFWNGSQWQLIGAWHPARREKVESVRRVGPPSSERASEEDQ